MGNQSLGRSACGFWEEVGRRQVQVSSSSVKLKLKYKFKHKLKLKLKLKYKFKPGSAAANAVFFLRIIKLYSKILYFNAVIFKVM